jgi:hypothetical protein
VRTGKLQKAVEAVYKLWNARFQQEFIVNFWKGILQVCQ